MKASDIAEQEEKFKTTLTNTSRVKYKVEDVTKLDTCEIHHIRPNFDDYYYADELKKRKIVLHYTVGTIRGDLASLTKKGSHMSVAYVVSRNGIIYELFDPKYWSYHLGRGSVGGNGYNSKESIGIELSNYGPLKEVGDNLETMYSEINYVNSKGNKAKTKKDVYCTKSNVGAYDHVPGGLRGYEYFASFTDEQIKSTQELVDYLCKKFDIPKNLMDESSRYDVFSSATEAKEFSGICSHINFRKTGKWDIGPNFPWRYLHKIKETTTPKPSIIHAEPDLGDTVVHTDTPERPKARTIVEGGVKPVKKNWINIIIGLIPKILEMLKKFKK